MYVYYRVIIICISYHIAGIILGGCFFFFPFMFIVYYYRVT